MNLLDPPRICWGCCLAARAEKALGRASWPLCDTRKVRAMVTGGIIERRAGEAMLMRLRGDAPSAYGRALHLALATACAERGKRAREDAGWKLRAAGHEESWPGGVRPYDVVTTT